MRTRSTALAGQAVNGYGWVNLARLATQITIGIAFLWFIFVSIEFDGWRFTHALRNASSGLLLSAVACFVIWIVFRSAQYLILISSLRPVGYVMGLVLTQTALLTFLPWRIGELSLPVLLHRDRNVSLIRSATATVIVRLADFSIVLLVAIGGMQKLNLGIEVSIPVYALMAAIAFLGVIFWFWFHLKVQSFLSNFARANDQLCKPARVGALVLISAGGFMVSTLQATFILRAFGLPVSLIEIAFLNAITLLAALLPIHPPGGWGTIDSIQIAVLHYLNYRPEESAPVILVAHGFYTLLLIFGGSLGWLIRQKSLLKYGAGYR